MRGTCGLASTLHFAPLAQFERRLIQEQTKAGLAAARARGRNGGRPKVTAEEAKVVLAKKLHADQSWSNRKYEGGAQTERGCAHRRRKKQVGNWLFVNAVVTTAAQLGLSVKATGFRDEK
jgi:DNA invertase Pin-like site-specific DNA recombinase